MMKVRSHGARLAVIGIVAAMAATGCGRRRPTVEMVEGRVLLDGEPAEQVNVGFSPISGERALPAIGRTGPDGSFRLTSMQGGAWQKGVPVGEYAVTFEKLGYIAVDEPLPKVPPLGKTFPRIVQPGSGLLPYLVFLPEAYGDRATSGFTATVKKGLNKVTFELRSDYDVPAAKPGEKPAAKGAAK